MDDYRVTVRVIRTYSLVVQAEDAQKACQQAGELSFDRVEADGDLQGIAVETGTALPVPEV